MNNYDELYELISSIDSKIKEIEKKLVVLEEVKPILSSMDNFAETIAENYKQIEKLFSDSLTRVTSLNKVISNELLVEYYNIFTELKKSCEGIMQDLIGSTNSTMTASTELAYEAYDNNLYNNSLSDIIIDNIGANKDVIPLPVEPKSDIEVLDV